MVLKIKSIIYIFIIIILAILTYILLNNHDSFESPTTTKQSFEKTQLYGSIFLENLDEVIKNMTDPPIMYDNKNIQLIRYNDVIL